MKDFAYWLRLFREEAGLNQKELAERVGYTSSYISMLESRKKPPPSDEVVRRLAESLGVDEARLLESAHLERTPYDIKEEFQSLRRRLERENRISGWIEGPFTRSILPLLLYQVLDPPPFLERTAEALAAPPILRKFHRRLVAIEKKAGGFASFAPDAAELAGQLEDDAFAALIEWLPRTLRPANPASLPERRVPFRLPIFIEVPWEPAMHAAETSGGWKAVPESLYAPGRYCLIASGTTMYPKIEEGDLVIVDETMPPESGDLVAVILEGRGGILRYLETGDEAEFAPINPIHPPVRVRREVVGSPGGPALRGVVVEIHREMR